MPLTDEELDLWDDGEQVAHIPNQDHKEFFTIDLTNGEYVAWYVDGDDPIEYIGQGTMADALHAIAEQFEE